MEYPSLFGLSLLFSAGCALACFSLRDFSYSRLEDLATRRGNLERFREIRQQQESASLVLEFCLTMLLMTTFTLVGVWIGVGAEASSGDNWRRVGWGVGLLLIIVVVVDLLPWVLSRVTSEWTLYTFWPLISLLRQIGLPVLGVATFVDRMAHGMTGRVSPEVDDSVKIADEISSKIV